MSSNIRSLGLAVLVVGMALFGSIAFVGSAAAASDGSIAADPADPGATSTHTVTLTVGSEATGSWNGFAIDYTDTDGDASNVGSEDVVAVGIDRDDDASGDTIDESVSDDFVGASAGNDGETLGLGFGGSYSLAEGDEVVVVIEDVVNPTSEGDHEIGLAVNPQSSGGTGTATLSIGAADGGVETTTDSDADTTDTETTTEDAGGDTTESDAGDTETAGSGTEEFETTDSDDSDDGTETTPSGGTPGFGVAAALVGLLAAGALALRRE